MHEGREGWDGKGSPSKPGPPLMGRCKAPAGFISLVGDLA